MSKPTPPPALDPDVRLLLERWAARPSLPTGELTAARVREEERQVLELQRPPPRLHSVEDLELPGPGGTLPVRVYRPLAGELQSLLYLHGGGFVIGREGYEAPLRELASATGCLVVAPEQRLAPEHPFPAAVEDAVAAAWWLSERAPSLGASRAAPGICGDSSGGNLAAIVSQALCRGGARPSFQALIYPMLDATTASASYREFATGFGFSAERSRWYFDRYLPRAIDRRAPSVSPLFELNLRELPPTLIVTAGFDPLRDEGERYAAALRAAGVDTTLSRYPGAIHGFFQMTGTLEASRRVHADLGRWIRVRSRQGATPARKAPTPRSRPRNDANRRPPATGRRNRAGRPMTLEPPNGRAQGLRFFHDRARYDAVLFDLDGVLTSTAALHAGCWKQVFDRVLAEWARGTGTPHEPFDVDRDYVAHVDGKARSDGVRDFLRARRIDVPEGGPDSPPNEWSVHGIGNLKQALIEHALATAAIEAFPGSVRLVQGLREAGVLTAVVSSSANCDEVLQAAGIAHLFELTVDGNDITQLGLQGKPAPDGFLEGARRLAIAPERAVVVEDALAGVAAGRAGGFGLVIGVARNGGREELAAAGADIVVEDLGELAS